MVNFSLAFVFTIFVYFMFKGDTELWHAAQYFALLSIWYELHDFVNKDKEK